MRAETAIAEYTPTGPVPAEAAAATVASGVLAIGKRVGGAAVERVPPRPCVLLRVGVLIGGGVVVWAGMVRERSYADISNIRIINTWIPYLLSRRFNCIISRS